MSNYKDILDMIIIGGWIGPVIGLGIYEGVQLW